MLKILNYKITAVVLFILLGWFSLSAWQAHVQSRQVTRRADELEAEIRTLEQDNETLGLAQEYFKSPAFLERQARLKLNYKEPGEEVVFIYNSTASSQPEAPGKRIKAMANYRKWWQYLLGKK